MHTQDQVHDHPAIGRGAEGGVASRRQFPGFGYERSQGAGVPEATPRAGQEEFLAMLAHEVRNPLAPIANAVAVLHGVAGNEPILTWVHDVIHRQVAQLSHVVDALLDASRVTTGRVSLHVRPVSLARIIEQAVDVARPYIDHRNQTLTVALPSDTVYVDGDLTRLAQAVGNLLDNASRFTQEGGSISVSATQQGDTVAITVRDNGRGIAAAELPYIFELFAHGGPSQTTRPGGFGIGLTIARAVVELHGGKLDAKSEGPGAGSEFTITLPPAREVPPEAKRSRPAFDSPASKFRIVLIDDDVDSNAALGMLLQRAGHEASAALNGLAGLELVRERKPDIVLCDIGLAGMDGYAVAARLREQDLDPRPTAIAITGYGEPEDRARALAAGFDHHLVKPVDPEVLLRLIAATGARASRKS